MKQFIFSIILALSISTSVSQNHWIYSAGSVKEDEILDICSDQSGNIISAGYFSGPTNFGNGQILNSHSLGTADIFVSKSNSNGQLIWSISAGGYGSDRATDVAVDSNGDIYITGFYYGNANFGNISVSSVNSSQDIFIAKLDANGNFIWVKSFGGNLAEWGNAITIDKSGNIILTGQFQGTSNFNGTTITSMHNPMLNFASFDVFTAKLDPSGNTIWLKTGSSKFDDRGLDILTDKHRNIYVCGQFSDTITFNQTHNNYIKNATFIIKYDSLGNEIWFKKAAGVFSIPYSLALDNNDNLYVTGDFQGTLTYFGNTSSFINGLNAKKTFLIKTNANGDFIWGKSESSNNFISSKKVAIDNQQNPYILGEFGCTLTEYSNLTSSALFNSIGFQDFFLTKYDHLGNRLWFKHFGGPRNDKAHGLIINSANEPVISGSYEHALNVPSNNNIAIINNITTIIKNGPFQLSNFCSAPNNYNKYTHLSSKGYSDAFILKGFDLSRDYYDYYERNNSTCVKDFVGSCINLYNNTTICPDTINICLSDSIYADTKTGDDGYYGPLHKFIWNNNAIDTLQKLHKNTSGYNTVKVSTIDGCYSSSDTVYVSVHALPQIPLLTDNLGVNNLQTKPGTPVSVCVPNTVTLTASNPQNLQVNWYSSNNTVVNSSGAIAHITSSAGYTVVLTDQFGCQDSNYVYVGIDNILPVFNPICNIDSVEICQNEIFTLDVFDSISNPAGIFPYNTIFHTKAFLTGSPNFTLLNPEPEPGDLNSLSPKLMAGTTGLYTLTINYVRNNTCMNDTITFNKQLYIKVKPTPYASLVFSGNSLMCPGDSITITPNLIAFNSTNISYTLTPNTLTTSSEGAYWFNADLIDTTSLCTFIVYDSVVVKNKPNPEIVSTPYNAVICPNDSILLSINYPTAQSYVWHGPTGIINNNSSSLFVKTSGFYHCVVTDITGCVFITNTLEIKNYASPFLLNLSSTPLCKNQSTTIQVVTLDTTLISWQAPLIGNSTNQSINTPGVYLCSVTMCNITSSLSISVFGASQTSSINVTGPVNLCPYDSITVSGNQGMVSYLWLPVGTTDSSYTIHSPGSYSLETIDNYGCSSTSNEFIVNQNLSIAIPTVSNDTICYGNNALLIAQAGNNQIDWFNNPNTGPVIYSGTTFSLSNITQDSIFYASAVDTAGCHSTGIPVKVVINLTSIKPVINSDSIFCNGDSILLSTNLVQNATYNWQGPGINNSTNTPNLIISNSSPSNSGLYILNISGSGCVSSSDSVYIDIIKPTTPTLSLNDSVCENSTLIIPLSSGSSSFSWSGPNSFQTVSDSLVLINTNLSQSGVYTVVSNEAGCMGDSSSINIKIIKTPNTPIISGNTYYCIGDTIKLMTHNQDSYILNWSGPQNFSSSDSIISIITTNTLVSGTYSITSINSICSASSSLSVHVFSYPTLHSTPDTVACDNQLLVLNSLSNYQNYIWNTGDTTSSISVNQSGTYWVKTYNGNCSVTDSIHVSIVPCAQIVLNAFSPNGDGANDIFMFKTEGIVDLACEIRDRWGVKIAEFKGIENGWDGKSMKTNQDCEEGSYFYVLEYKTIEGVSKTINGFVNLFR